MARQVTFEMEGMKEVDAALGTLSKAVARNALRRVLRLAAVPVADAIRARAPVLTGQLRDSVAIITPKAIAGQPPTFGGVWALVSGRFGAVSSKPRTSPMGREQPFALAGRSRSAPRLAHRC